MSIWTHVNGSIRVDGLPFINNLSPKGEEQIINKIVGKAMPFNDLEKLDFDKEPKCDLPLGDEDSIQYKFIHYGRSNSITRGTIVFWGDLRGYDNPQLVIDWFKKLVESFETKHRNTTLSVRDAIIDAYCEINNCHKICVKTDNGFKELEVT